MKKRRWWWEKGGGGWWGEEVKWWEGGGGGVGDKGWRGYVGYVRQPAGGGEKSHFPAYPATRFFLPIRS